ncbi:hypothetical protein HMPREF0765_3542 [Sphingobacterium spiritivorum ATCC 33300]|uniref:Uncharacterized protein n=2 Tax=Sphingobacterium spiritivorum TaxID=258 RepID=C2G1T6_SPHSI|nr:hypothetical protein HMPREF0765_3542 [Sphingobacterium spiritivorum ATCC 33300]QQS98297.1 hypothetical protein I6J03_09245 [Sphingobacterium spiritivorum]
MITGWLRFCLQKIHLVLTDIYINFEFNPSKSEMYNTDSLKNFTIRLVILFVALQSFHAQAQFGKLGDIVNKGVSKALNSSQLKLLKSDPITTNFDDCNQEKTLVADFGKDSVKTDLCTLSAQYTKTTGFRLKPGFYKGTFKSFCLQAGTYGPSRGDAYLFAPLAGPKEKIARTLIANWENHPEIEQSQVQVLLWAIIAKTNFTKLSPELQATAAILLSQKDLSALGSSVIDYLSGEAMQSLTQNLPEPAKTIVEIENKIRGLMYKANASYQEIESLAMLTGVAPVNEKFPRGIWSFHPDGYYIKYLPQGYSVTSVEIYVPQQAGTIDFLPTGDVAVPASRGSQRLGQSNILICDQQ